MKKCPFCAELIQDEAIICRFCNRDQSIAEGDRLEVLINKLETGKNPNAHRVSQQPVYNYQNQSDKRNPGKTGIGKTLAISLVIFAILAIVIVAAILSFPVSGTSSSSKSVGAFPERILLDSRGTEACSDFRKLRSEGEQSLALNMVNLGANAASSSNYQMQKSGGIIAKYLICDENPGIKDCVHVTKTELLRALADIETVCKSH